MIVKIIKKTPVTNEELNEYKERISKLENEYAVNASDVGIDKRIVTIKFGGDYDDLTLVNPIVTETSEEMVVYFEKDSVKQKTRKTQSDEYSDHVDESKPVVNMNSMFKNASEFSGWFNKTFKRYNAR